MIFWSLIKSLLKTSNNPSHNSICALGGNFVIIRSFSNIKLIKLLGFILKFTFIFSFVLLRLIKFFVGLFSMGKLIKAIMLCKILIV